MDKRQQSFIPQKSGEEANSGHSLRGGGALRNPFAVIAGIIFIAALLIWLGLFLYQFYMNSQINAMAQALKEKQPIVAPELEQKLLTLDARIKATDTILNNHVATSLVFGLLAENTIAEVQYTDFELTTEGNEGGFGQPHLSLQGVAQNYQVVALEEKKLEADENIHDVSVRRLSLDGDTNRRDGDVRFSVNATVDKGVIEYLNRQEQARRLRVSDVAGVATTSTSQTREQQPERNQNMIEEGNDESPAPSQQPDIIYTPQ